MAMIKCSECGQMVSDRAKTCIHCGNPLGKPDYTLKIKTPTLPDCLRKVPFIFYNDDTGEELVTVYQNQIATFNFDKPTRIKCIRDVFLSRKPFYLDYTPHENARYQIVDDMAVGQRFVEVDVFDTDSK